MALVSSSHAAAACGVVQNLVVRAIVEPALIGVWTTIRTVLEYANYASLGANRAAGRDIAIAAGRGDMAAQRRVADVAMTIEIAVGALVAVVLAAVSGVLAVRGQVGWAGAFGAGAAISVVSRYHAFNLTALRSHKQFHVLARARVIGAVSDMLLLTAGVWAFSRRDAGFAGLLCCSVVAHGFNAWYVRSAGGLRFRAACDWPLTLGLLAAGWPIAADALALTALRSIDRVVLIALAADGATQVGWYSIAAVLGTWAFDQANLIANVIYPRLGEALGRTSDETTVLCIGLRSAEVIAQAMVVGAAVLLAVGVPAVDWLLPKYRPGLAAAPGLVAAAMLLGTVMPLRHSLVTIGRATSLLAATGLAGGAALAAGAWVVSRGGGLDRLAWTSAAAAGFCLVAVLVLCCAGRRQLAPLAARVAVAAGYGAAGAAVLGATRGSTLHFALAAGLSLPPLVVLLDRINWREVLRPDRSTADDASTATSQPGEHE